MTPARRPLAAIDWRVLGFVAGAVLLLVVFRQLVFASIGRSMTTVSQFADGVVGDFKNHVVPALVMLAIVQTVRRHAPASGWRRFVVVGVTVMVAAVFAVFTRAVWFAWVLGEPPAGWAGWNIMLVRFALLGGLLVAVGEFHRAQVRSLEAMRAAEADRSALEQQTLQARLKTLEAQIEPHFLFNVLANVRRLYDTDAQAGAAMLARLMAYLQTALPSIRGEAPTLGREARLVEAYLDLQRVRMGRRLAYRVDIAPALQGLEVPPMMLLTLVENAIKHGLAPQREGGTIEIGARLEGNDLRLEVADDGRGFGGSTSGGGTGLANIRARLAAMFGHAAGLALTQREPRGLAAVIRLPVGPAAATS